jgi:hypothetical protein
LSSQARRSAAQRAAICGEPARVIGIVQAPRFAVGINYQSWLFMRAFIDRLSFRTRVVLMICIVLTTYVIVIFQFPS